MDTSLKEERNLELLHAYHQYMREDANRAKNMPLTKFIENVINSGASRFYISVEQAQRYIAQMESGKPLNVRGEKLRMCNDLYEVYKKKCIEFKGYYKYRIIEESVYSLAPSFYLSVSQAYKIIYK